MQLTYGATNAFDALVYGEKHPGTVQFLKNQIESASNMLTSAGRSFYESAKATFEHFNGNAAINFARTAIKTIVGGNMEVQRITYLHELQHLQKASVIMQRWVMACPQVRTRYLDQTLDGYSDTYENIHGTDVGWKHYDYRRATDGLVVFEDDGSAVVHQYHEELRDGDRELTLAEKADIYDTWSAINVLLAMGDDPTNPSGSSL